MSELFYYFLWLIPILAVIATGLCVFIVPNKTNGISKSSYCCLLWVTIVVSVLNIVILFYNTAPKNDDTLSTPSNQENSIEDIDTIKREYESINKLYR